MIRRQHRWAAVLALFGLFSARMSLAASTQDATVTVTPMATVSLSLSAAAYDFESIDVNTSTNSATALTLTNNGQVSVTVDKRILNQSTPAGWTAAASPALDTYVLYVATAAARPSLSEFSAATRLGAEGAISALTGTTGAVPVLTPVGTGQSVDLWFRLDMPTAVSTLSGRTVSVRFTATAE